MPTKKLTTEQFIQKANLVHNNKYDYSQTIYVYSKTKVIILCREHGEFQQTPNCHLRGKGCPLCSGTKARQAKAKSEFIQKAQEIHGDKYDYSLVNYTNNSTKINIVCREHGSFLQRPSDHLRQKGCAKCAKEYVGWTRTKFKERCIKNNESKGILYILECYNGAERFIKIGITSNSIKRRYDSKAKMPYEYTVLHAIIGDPEFIYDLETLLHRKSKNYKYTPNVPFKGHVTECFEANPTYLDKLNTYLDFKNTKQQ